jgi:6-pyruvoyltetrahydropterin/6-carboxytetrahydropterin synthase
VFTVHLAKEPFKFSCSHFTILSPSHGERLHGHNYQVRVDLALKDLDPKLGLSFDFNAIKPKIRMVCDELDERILLPLKSPYLTLSSSENGIQIEFGKKKYAFPAEDCFKLEIANVTAEELSRYIATRLAKLIDSVPGWTSMRVEVEETRGQSVSYLLCRS